MDLGEVLNKTKKRSEQIKVVRKPPSVASVDRPYSIDNISENNQDASLVETDNKSTTNRQQIGNKPATESATNRQQTGNKINMFSAPILETGNKPTIESATESTTNRQQIGNKSTTKPSFSRLVGLERSLLWFIYNECKFIASKTTSELTNEHIAITQNTTYGSVKVTLQRLEAKGYIIRADFKAGRGGWTKYQLTDSLYQEMLYYETSNKSATNRQQIGNKSAIEPATEPTTISSSSSNNINNIKTTTTEEWPDFDIEPLTSIGFTKTHVQQIAQQGRVPKEVVQDSVYMFAFDLEHNKKAASIKGSPLNFFMGILRKGDPYNPPDNYESPSDRARRLYKEDLQRREKIRLAEEKQIIDLSFNEWLAEKTEEYKYSLLSDAARATKANFQKMLEWRDFYVKEIWPQQLKEIMKK